MTTAAPIRDNETKPGHAEPFRVMLADDSAVVRGLLTRMLEADPEIVVVASVGDGQMAIRTVERMGSIEVVVLDLEMPRMDGLTALPELMRADPNLQVIMASTLTLRNADITLKAPAAGAKDTIPKPSTGSALNQAGDFKRELIAKIKALGEARRRLGVAPARSSRVPRLRRRRARRRCSRPPRSASVRLSPARSTSSPSAARPADPRRCSSRWRTCRPRCSSRS